MECFQICSADRSIREVVIAEPSLQSLKSAAFLLIKKPIVSILLESSGCRVSSDIVLKHFKNEMLMFLTCNEVWTSAGPSLLQEESLRETTEENDQQKLAELDQAAEVDNDLDLKPTTELIEVMIPDDDSSEITSDATEPVAETSQLPAAVQAEKIPDLPIQPIPVQQVPESSKKATVAAVQPTVEDSGSAPKSTDAEEEGGNPAEVETPEPPTKSTTAAVEPAVEEPGSSRKLTTAAEESDEQMLNSSSTTDDSDSNASPADSSKPASSAGKKQPAQLKTISRKSSICMKFDHFKVNWKKLDDGVTKRLNEKDSLARKQETHISNYIVSKKDRLLVVNMVVDQLRQVDTVISACVMEAVAKKIIETFFCFQFNDDDGVQDLNRGWSTLKSHLIDRNNYLNRPKRPNQTTITAKEAKQMRNTHAGTNPNYWSLRTAECDNSIKSKLKRDDPNVLTDTVLQNSLGFIRHILDQKIPLLDIVKEWPVIRRRKLVEFHFYQATGVNLMDLSTYFNAKRNNILCYANQIKANSELDESSSDFDYFSFICRCLGEQINNICVQKEIWEIDSLYIMFLLKAPGSPKERLRSCWVYKICLVYFLFTILCILKVTQKCWNLFSNTF